MGSFISSNKPVDLKHRPFRSPPQRQVIYSEGPEAKRKVTGEERRVCRDSLSLYHPKMSVQFSPAEQRFGNEREDLLAIARQTVSTRELIEIDCCQEKLNVYFCDYRARLLFIN